MSEIVKTEAVVLNKINYGDTSSIASIYTNEFGKLSAIIKGGRNPKSKIGSIVDPLNHLNLVLYKKDTRDVQLISSSDIISHFSKIKEDFDKLEHAYAVIELIKKLTPEHENNQRLFKGLVRILSLLETSKDNSQTLFARFFVFFLEEIGYEVLLDKCTSCGKSTAEEKNLSYRFEIGILCNECSSKFIGNSYLDPELFYCLRCLKHNKNDMKIEHETMNKAIAFLEKYLKFHVTDFKGFQTFQLLKQR